MVEDHPLDYATFEGVIAHGNYGAGQVIVWDAGTYSPDEDGRLSFGDRDEAEERMRAGLEAGKLSFTLRGRKLHGSWTLVKTTRSPNDWLLIKHRDRYADPGRDVLTEDTSVQSGLTIDELKEGRLPEPGATAAVADAARAVGETAEFPSRIKPMLARLVDAPFSGREWLFEPKLDGFRALAFLHRGAVTLTSRTGIDLTGRFPEVVAELESQPEDELVLDGEIVALNDSGLPDFGLLQNRIDLPREIKVGPSEGAATVVYYPFDLLYVHGSSLLNVPLYERKGLLARAVVAGDHVQLVEHVEGEGKQFFDAAVRLGLEGMVAKRKDSRYQPGTRSPSWLKVKAVQAQELAVGGYTPGAGYRSKTFGALVLGYYEGEDLKYAGRVGSGFDQATLDMLVEKMRELQSGDSPFAPDPDLDALEVQWLRPEMVVRVKFSNWTDQARLRAPVFMGLRPEIDPRSVRRETADRVSTVDATQAPPRTVEDDVDEVLDQLSDKPDSLSLEVDGHRIALTNLDKPLWPEHEGRTAVTKREVVRYFATMGPVLLPHLRDRPLTLTRYPDGIHGESFYQKHWEHNLPDFVETVELFSSHNEGAGEYIAVNNLPTLVWLAQIADLELHPWLSRTVREPDALDATTDFAESEDGIRGSVLNRPDFIVFDLDPYIYSGREKAGDEPELNRAAFAKTAEIALELKDILDQLSLSAYLKTSGKTGLHIYVPVLRRYEYRVTRKTCEIVGRFLMRNRPRDVTMEWSVSKRAGKVFLGHNQNVRAKNMASIYSLRPLPGAPVSIPLRWTELEDVYPTMFTIDTVPERVAETGDLWVGLLEAKHDLSRLLEADTD
jgi:bifunctional non-homologous end joining protein LigD